MEMERYLGMGLCGPSPAAVINTNNHQMVSEIHKERAKRRGRNTKLHVELEATERFCNGTKKITRTNRKTHHFMDGNGPLLLWITGMRTAWNRVRLLYLLFFFFSFTLLADRI